MHAMRLGYLGLAGLLSAGCSSSGDGPSLGPPTVATITVAPSTLTLDVDQTAELTATVRDATGNVITVRPVTWSSENENVATVTTAGRVTGAAEGQTRILATVGTVSGASTISVTGAETVASVTLEPVAAVSAEGGTAAFVAIARDRSGTVVRDKVVHWVSADPAIADVDGRGAALALKPGIATISARVEGVSGAASLRVEAQRAYELTYTVTIGGHPALYALDIDDAAAVPRPVLAPAPTTVQASASPDGAWLAFVVPAEDSVHIWASRRDGRGAGPLTTAVGVNDQPAWSPDGTRIAYRHRAPGGDAHIWIMAADGSDARPLTADHGATSQSSPAWSPDLGEGRYLIAYSHAERGAAHLWSMRADGSRKHELTSSDGVFDDRPSWSPDGTRIVFQRSADGIFADLYVVDARGGEASPLMRSAAPLAGTQTSPAFSPDGTLIAFASRHESDHSQIYTVWADGTRLVRRTSEAQDHADPIWIEAP